MPSPECRFVFGKGKAVCLVCGRVYRAPSGKLRGVCRPREVTVTVGGPGTELKKLLRLLGFRDKVGCKCRKRAQVMDSKGCNWCEENIGTISGWLEEEARRRRLPYSHVAGKALIRMAIRRAMKKGNGQ